MGVLKACGLLEARPGSGTYIQSPTSGDVSAFLGPLLSLQQLSDRYQDLNEVRRTLLVEIAGLAAERAEPKDIAVMEAALVKIKRHAQDVNQFTHYEIAFQSALGAATHNEVYRVFVILITNLLLKFHLAACRCNPRDVLESILYHHPLILECIKAQDPVGARRMMRQHLCRAESLIEAVYNDEKAL
jgi:DNA-binding FadR family transcriptional regulator